MVFNNQRKSAMKAKNKNYMWYKVKELSDKGLNKSQISMETGIDRATVRKYLSMKEKEFHLWLNNPKHLPHKLAPFMRFIKTELTQFPFLSAAQIEDRLKENFSDIPDIHSKTVYNFVQIVRKKYHLEKPAKEHFRQCEKLAEVAYGKQAQVDFGQCFMQTGTDKRVKIYFFCMVLSRSRMKFVYFQNQPFTAKTAVYAHELAFEYFEGIAKEILYDQDKVFIHDENLGDYLLTHDFKSFSQTQAFKIVFCRKADPQSKGKIESVVKYIKYNFLKGRIYSGIETLNQSAKQWLERTGNGKKHSTTLKIPLQEWHIEKTHLLPLKFMPVEPTSEWQIYNVRKDNTVAYRGNFYTLPLGTYQGTNTKVYLELIENRLNIYSKNKQPITNHQVSLNKGELVRNTNHGRDLSLTWEQTQKEVLQILGNTEKSILYLELLKTDKPRYYHDNLRAIKHGLTSIPKEIIEKTILFCLETKTYNGHMICEIATNYLRQNQQKDNLKIYTEIAGEKKKTIIQQISITPQTSNINTYEKLF